jgi:hypothetical protein
MVRFALFRSICLFSPVCCLCGVASVSVAHAAGNSAAPKSIRAGAAVSVSFDDADRLGAVAVKGVAEPFSAKLVGNPSRVPSPFWNQAGHSALRFDAAKRQSVRLIDIPYTSRPDAVTLSFFFLSLHPQTDAAPHGILAKRSLGPRGTNYGINYVPASDIFQLYVNDGSGFRVASYSAQKVLGTRRLVHLTATLEVDDQSATGNGPDLADVRARLFVNGEPALPKSVVGPGRIHNRDVWFSQVNTAGLLTDAPLTLGCSTPEMEYTSGVIDEFLLFTRALSPSEVSQLFLEIAGPHGPELARRELQPVRPIAEPPAIASLSQFGLQIGQTTRLSINGARLAGKPRIDLPIPGVKQTLVKGSTPTHLMVDITVPADAPPGIYPLTVFTAGGVSNPMGIALDGLAQWLVGDSTEDRPTSLPAAFSGLISGPGQSRVFFRGHAHDRLVAEVEARRIGSRLDPVLEVKTVSGSTIAIEWGKAFLRGDARAELTLPADGTYVVELHDLAYNAPAESPFRLLLGDFRSVDSYYPPVIPRGADWPVELVGAGIPPGTMADANLKHDAAGLAKLLPLPRELHASGPLPPLGISDGIEVLEVSQPTEQLQMIDARFADKRHESVAVNGRLAKESEVDRYLLAVTPGMPLTLALDGRSLNSPVEGEISIYAHPDGRQLGGDGGTPGAAAKGFQFAVPADVSSIEVAVRDLTGRGGRHFVYRLRISPATAPDFSLALLTTQVNIPQNGRTMVRLQVDRRGYGGPIKLRAEGTGATGGAVTIAPAELPADGQNRTLFVTFTTKESQTDAAVRGLRIVGESVGISPAIRRAAVIQVPNQAELSGFLDRVPVGALAASPLAVDLAALPREVYKGSQVVWPIVLTAASKKAMGIDPDAWVRLSLVSTETGRPVAPNKPRLKPLVAALPDQAMPLASAKGTLRVAVPADVVEPTIEFVVKADVVRHPYAAGVLATTYSEPFQVAVKDKPAPAPPAAKPATAKAAETKPAAAKKKAG